MSNITNILLDTGDLSQALQTCSPERCNNVGKCVISNGKQVCRCMLGYIGDACFETVNWGLSIPLCLGVLAFIICFIILAFAMAFVQQRRRERLWEEIDEKRTLKNNGNVSDI